MSVAFLRITRVYVRWLLGLLILILVFSQSASTTFASSSHLRTHGSLGSSEIGYLGSRNIFSGQQGFSLIYLPFQSRAIFYWGSNLPVMLGIYSQAWPGSDPVLQDEFVALDNWAGKRLSIAGTFVDFTSNPDWHINLQLGIMRDYGYTPFLNLNTNVKGMTAKFIADGGADTYLRAVARSFVQYSQGGTRMAFVAPLQEMNGSWVVYGLDPANWKRAFLRIKSIFYEEGVPRQSVRWVFAPNGSSTSGYPELEAYYPGDAEVDAVAVSAYNLGYCPYFNRSIQGWHSPQVAIGTYLKRIVAMAPKKMAFLAQTATSSYTQHGKDDSAKNQWLNDAYTYITTFPTLKGIIYYNRWNAECDWAFFQKDGKKYDGYRQAIQSPLFEYVPPDDLLH